MYYVLTKLNHCGPSVLFTSMSVCTIVKVFDLGSNKKTPVMRTLTLRLPGCLVVACLGLPPDTIRIYFPTEIV